MNQDCLCQPKTRGLWDRFVRRFQSRSRCPKRRARSVVNVEQLEQRICLTPTVFELGSSLVIAGDSGDDQIEIVDHGGGTLNVNGTEYSGIDSLLINTAGGADHVFFESEGELSISNLLLNLGSCDDVAEFNFGTVSGKLQSRIFGGAGDDVISTSFVAVLADAEARSIMHGGFGDDVIICSQSNVAGQASCVSRGGFGNDQIFCNKINVLAGGEAICESFGGFGDDIIMCTDLDIAGHTECIGNGGLGHDVVSCTLTNLAESGSALCKQSGGFGDDVLICDKGNVQGVHVCFINGGAGNDIMNWVITGTENSGSFQCNADGGSGDDAINIVAGTATDPISGNGFVVEYFADTGSGNDVWQVTANFTPETVGVFPGFTVLLGEGNDTAILNFLGLGNTQIPSGLIDGGDGEDTYFGPPPFFLQFPVLNFEVGV